MATVAFERVRKLFGARVAVESLDLAIDDGEFVCLLGPSGCGKTTTLRMLAGLEQPTSGVIRIGERVVNELPPSDRDIAMVFQSYALYPHMTAGENITYPLRKRGIRDPERARRVQDVASLLRLDALLDRKPRQLSGGEQQRVALGRALVRDPQVFLLDEPLSNLDAKLRAHMRAELIQLHQRIGRTVVYVTHDQLEAMTMSGRIAVMNAGVLQQFAPPADIYHRPANVFVAGFIGTPAMTILPGHLTGRGPDGRVAVRVAGLDVSLPAGQLREPFIVGPVTVGVRPEDVLIGQGPYIGVIRVVEPTGHESIVMLEVERATFTARVAGDAALRAGDAAPFGLREDRLHLFDAANGARINADRGRSLQPVPLEAAG